MIVQVEYTVPVMVFVDTREGTIDRVVVLDEDVRRADHGTCFYEGGDPVTSPRAKRRAAEVAASGMWPGWEFGY